MGAHAKSVLRPLSEAEKSKFQCITRASSERVDVVKRSKALLTVAAGATFNHAGQASDLSREGVSQLVVRFNQRGLSVLMIAPGRGRKLLYGAQARAQVVQEVCRQPDREQDQTTTWSLKLLQRSLCRAGLKTIGATTIGRILHEESYLVQRDRTWCETGPRTDSAKMASIVSMIPKPREKKSDRVGLSDRGAVQAACLMSR